MPTALELSRNAWQSYIDAAREQPFSDTRKDPQEHAYMMDRLHETAAMLKMRFGARRVFLFGSQLRSTSVPKEADIDLAVEGLTGAAYWQAWRTVEEFIPECAVDLIDLAMAGPSLRSAILKDGLEL